MADTEIEDSALSAIVAAEIRSAQMFDQTKRTLAIEYQRGEMNDLPARVSGSSQTDRTFADALAWTLPGVVRVFTASDQMVQFEATQVGGEEGSEEASEYTNYSFFRENDGYRILYNATYDSLLMGNGAACSYWCPPEIETKTFKDKTDEELALLLEEGWGGAGVEPKPGTPRAGNASDPLTGEDVAIEEPTYTVKLQRETRRGQIKDMTLKPENLLLNSTATQIGERFTAYLHDDKTRSDLMDMADEYGWDKETIENLPAYRGNSSPSEVSNARRFDNPITDSAPVKSGDLVDLYECYVRADVDGDGVAELLQVWYAGNAGGGELLSFEEWEDDVPFTDIPCYPVPHSWVAESLFDRTADIQRVKTTLLRQLLDNTYAVGLPMQEVEEGSVLNPDALVNKRFGGLIWKKKTSAPIIPHVTPFIGDKLMLGLNYMDEMAAKRTGISKTTMALDPEALQNQTATGTQLQHDAGYSQIELIARNMAELGWVKFFAKRRNLAKKYIKEPVQIPSKNGEAVDGAATGAKYRTIQPERWSDDMACTINVGLGTGSRDRDMAMLNTILNGQIGMADRLAQGGFRAKAIEFIPKIRKTAVEMAESSGLRNPGDYYPPITDEELAKMQEAAAQPPGPPPEVMIEQMKGENAKALKQIDAQVDMQTAELQAQNAVLKNQAELDADMQTAGVERQSKLELESVKQQNENARFFAKLAQDRELALLQIGMADKETGETGEDGEPVKKPVDATTAMLMDGLTKLGEMVGGLSASMSAPTEIVRGPDGRAVGTRKVVN